MLFECLLNGTAMAMRKGNTQRIKLSVNVNIREWVMSVSNSGSLCFVGIQQIIWIQQSLKLDSCFNHERMAARSIEPNNWTWHTNRKTMPKRWWKAKTQQQQNKKKVAKRIHFASNLSRVNISDCTYAVQVEPFSFNICIYVCWRWIFWMIRWIVFAGKQDARNKKRNVRRIREKKAAFQRKRREGKKKNNVKFGTNETKRRTNFLNGVSVNKTPYRCFPREVNRNGSPFYVCHGLCAILMQHGTTYILHIHRTWNWCLRIKYVESFWRTQRALAVFVISFQPGFL